MIDWVGGGSSLLLSCEALPNVNPNEAPPLNSTHKTLRGGRFLSGHSELNLGPAAFVENRAKSRAREAGALRGKNEKRGHRAA